MVADQPRRFTVIEHFADADDETLPGRQLAAIRSVAPSFQSWFRAQGVCRAVRTCDLIALPYPREFALWRAALSPVPYVRIFNRMMVVQWRDEGGVRTMLVEPATQYNSMLKEKLVADRGGPGGEWVQHFCSSEPTPWALAPGVSPSFTYSGISHGELVATGAVEPQRTKTAAA